MAQVMTNMTFIELDRCFKDNRFPEIENDINGGRYLKIRSLSRNDLMEGLMESAGLDFSLIGKRQYPVTIFESDISNNDLDNFINTSYEVERSMRRSEEDDLIDQLSRLQNFDWGGSHQNGLEKNIVDNYVKKIKRYDEINQRIETTLLDSVRGYTLNSWYNHWTSILIEDVFKDSEVILPAIGLVKKIDFFINDIPFDLKVTYFPEDLMKDKLKQKGYGVELTKLKQKCRALNIIIPTDLNEKALRLHLYNKLSEDTRPEAEDFIATLNNIKREIIREAKQSPSELKVWLYENQGEKRFDAANRFYLILIDEDNYNDSWKLKRNIRFIREKVSLHLQNLHQNLDSLATNFHWQIEDKDYQCKSDILFLSLSRQ